MKAENQRALESYLESEDHRGARREKFSVFVMGDSTHYWSLQPQDYMVPVLERAIAAKGVEDIAIYGVSGGALNAFDFYLVLNRIVHEKPDVVVVPVGMRSFSEFWLEVQSNAHPPLRRKYPRSIPRRDPTRVPRKMLRAPSPLAPARLSRRSGFLAFMVSTYSGKSHPHGRGSVASGLASTELAAGPLGAEGPNPSDE